MKSLVTLFALVLGSLVSLASSPALAQSPDLHDGSARVAALLADPTMACYGVAAGRGSVPIRENYFTYSPIVDTLRAGKVFIGQRVANENKVLVFTPFAEGDVGIARFTFTAVVPNARCQGTRLYQPTPSELLTWVMPLAGQPAPPRPAQFAYGSWGCFSAKRWLTAGYAVVPKDHVFFAARGEVDGHYTRDLTVLDGVSGAELGVVDARRADQVPVAKCAPGVAFQIAP